MADPIGGVANPKDAKKIAQKVDSLDRIITNGLDFGDPTNALDPDDTTLAGAGNHQGRNGHLKGAWVEVSATAKNSKLVFTHNLGLPQHGANERNVRWRSTTFKHDASGLSDSTVVDNVNIAITGSVADNGSTITLSNAYGALSGTSGTASSGVVPWGTAHSTGGPEDGITAASNRLTNNTGETIIVQGQYHFKCVFGSNSPDIDFYARKNGTKINNSGGSIVLDTAANQEIVASGNFQTTLTDTQYVDVYFIRNGGAPLTKSEGFFMINRVDLGATLTLTLSDTHAIADTSTTTSVENGAMSLEFQDGDTITEDSIELRLRAPGRTVDSNHPVKVSTYFTSAVRG